MMFGLQFQSLQEVFWMNGHGPYVWSAWGIALIAMAFLVCSPLLKRRAFLKNLRRRQSVHSTF